MPFGNRARIYPGPAPLAEIVLNELSARHIKQPAGLVVGSEKTSEREEAEIGKPTGDVEFGRTISGDRQLLVAGKSSRKSPFCGADE
jgi:hypothetical protein